MPAGTTTEKPRSAVLIAEDEDHVAKLVVFKLTHAGLDVTVARDGREALELLPSRRWSAILLDVMMPHLDGWRVLETLRQEPAYRSVPVLMLTARGDGDDGARARERGADDCLRKPFDPADLAARVLSLVARSEASAAAPLKTDAGEELRALTRDFLATLPGRRDSLRFLRLRLKQRPVAPDTLEGIRLECHKLAGVAGSYGFQGLSDVSGRIDDWLGGKREKDPGLLERFSGLLEAALAEVIRTGKDPENLGSDPAMAELIGSG